MVFLVFVCRNNRRLEGVFVLWLWVWRLSAVRSELVFSVFFIFETVFVRFIVRGLGFLDIEVFFFVNGSGFEKVF